METRWKINNQRGAVLLMVLVSITLLGLMAGIAGSSWQTTVQRAKEADLLWKGNQIRRAIESYYTTSHAQGAAPKAFPSELGYLILDPRFLEIQRHLRRLYPDPMTGKEWDIIKGPSGQVIGVKSSSNKVPFKQDGFSEVNQSFRGQKSYKNWQFIYQPQQNTQLKKPAPKS
ncbi:MAG: type II secretion system GspH family protein [Deltaproteobacteria bacterium]|nr:type II secretion system GspH family protein [Deltaproteobacteria bacterium]MCW8894139.1 type II secretion system GspH family protein [Deltaproteobacteria bacterium]MCW9048930.1 type II secretion system GspH family protein [Deltaproteobacteria bacterium]